MKSFERKNGFGFLACPELFEKYKRDVFIHQAFIGTLQVGDTVDFAYRINDKGQPQVVSVEAKEAPKPKEEEERIEGVGGPKRLKPKIYQAQKRLTNRTCICIEDPMEAERTLGPTFLGQERISYELRRAVAESGHLRPSAAAS